MTKNWFVGRFNLIWFYFILCMKQRMYAYWKIGNIACTMKMKYWSLEKFLTVPTFLNFTDKLKKISKLLSMFEDYLVLIFSEWIRAPNSSNANDCKPMQQNSKNTEDSISMEWKSKHQRSTRYIFQVFILVKLACWIIARVNLRYNFILN